MSLTTPTKCSGKRLRKQKSSTSKKKKLESGVSNDLPIDNMSTDDDNDDDDDDDDGNDDIDWKKLEEVLEESAQKANLTAVNVKSILHVRLCFLSLSVILFFKIIMKQKLLGFF